MSACDVVSGTHLKATGCHTIVISPPIIPSPYNSKNAGRKKTNPVWNYFVDLKTKGLSGVRCRYCEWITNDRSPTTLKFHLKRKHDTGLGGIWNIVEERIGINQPQNRNRVLMNNKNGDVPVAAANLMDTDVRAVDSDREQKCYPETGARVVVDAKPSSSQQLLLDQFIQNATKNVKQNGNSSSGNVPSTATYTPSSSNSYEVDIYDTKSFNDGGLLPLGRVKSSSPKVECDEGSENGDDSEFALSDGQNIAELLHVANDMDLAFTYNSRRIGEFCFESNAHNMRGRLVVFADLGTKIAVRERFNGNDLSYEEWRKSDWKQFLWAVRGKCMNVLRGL